jgi:PPM family protein phosphatase
VTGDIEIFGLSDVGRMREQNEDSIGVDPALGVAVLADGMGGHQAGEVASRLAVDVISRHLTETLTEKPARHRRNVAAPEVTAVQKAIHLANAAIHEVARARPECAGMGSTVVVAVFRDDYLCVGHVGDSRLYRYRDGRLEQLTRDHSVIEELVGRGLLTHEEARQTIGKNLVTRALGIDEFVAEDTREEKTRTGDLYLLCSDGLNDVVTDDDIAAMLALHSGALDQLVHQLVKTANERGGPDNISVIVARTGTAAPPPPPAPESEKDENGPNDWSGPFR